MPSSNPAAGGGRCGRAAAQVLPELRTRGVELEVRETEGPGDAARIARESWGEGARCFLAVGGDGTAYEVVNGIVPRALATGEAPKLGILPLGTGNSFVRDFAEDGTAYSIEAIASGRSRPCDILRIRHTSGELFALGTVSLAFPAVVAALVNRRLKPFGRVGYTLGVLASLAALAPLRLELATDDDPTRQVDATLLCLQNNRYTGGNMLMAPEAKIDDGLLDLVLAGPIGRLGLLRTFPRIFEGTHVNHPAVTLRTHRQVEFHESSELPVMIDGESLRLALRSVEVVPGAIEVLL